MKLSTDTIEAAAEPSHDVRVPQMRPKPGPDNREPMPTDDLADRVATELRGSPLFDDVPARRGREKPPLQGGLS